MAKMKDKAGGSGLLSFCKFGFILVFFQLERSSVLAQTYCEDKPKILFYRRGDAALVSSDGENSENHVVVSNLNKEFLACVSSRNVEWTYEGEGEPSKFQESSNVDIQKYEDGSISYCLTSQITFYNKQSDTELSKHTGRYICREIGNNTNAASVYVYASRKNSPTFLHSRKTVALPLNQANITSVTAAAVPQRASGESYNVSRHFTIPCATTRPTTGSVKLLKKGKNNVFSRYVGAAFKFDPRFGFQVNVKTTNLEDLSEFYGEYKCVSTAASRRASDESSAPVEDFVLFTIFKGKSLKIFPPVTEVYTSGMLNLTCESEEPVIMKEMLPPSAQDIYSYLDEDDYTRDRSDDIIETTEKTEQTSHIANYMELAPAPGRTGEIQCLTEKDAKILHTWKYRIIRKRADKLSGIKFNKRESSFTCKSKLGAPGKLSFISCRTPSECRINKVCLTKSESCRGYSNSTKAFCERKSHFCGKIFYKGGSGLIRCIGEGIDEIRGFTDEAADLAVRMGFGKLKASETALLQVVAVDKKDDNHNAPELALAQQEDINRISEGDRVNVTVRLGYYYFLYPVQWAVKFRNGSTSQINPDPQTLQVDKLTRTVHASLELPYTSATILRPSSSSSSKPQQPQISEIMALNVLIPLRSSTEPSWKTISLPITIYGKVGLKRLPTDAESEELEQIPQTDNKNIPGGEQAAAASLNADVTATEASNIEADDEDEESDDDIVLQPVEKASSINNPVDESPAVGNDVKLSQTKDDDNDEIKKRKTDGDGETSDAEATTALPDVDSGAVTSNKMKDRVVFINTPEVEEVVQPNEILQKKLDTAAETVDQVSESETILARSGLLDEDFNEDEVKDEVTTLRAAAARLLNEEEGEVVEAESDIETTTVS